MTLRRTTSRQLSLLLFAAALAGCASREHQAEPPAAAPVVNGQSVQVTGPCPATLDPGRSCWALVQAWNWYSDTGVRVARDQTYCIRIPSGQAWRDANRHNSPPKGEPGNLLMNAFGFLKRHPLPWFTLMAGVVEGAGPGIQPSSDLKPRPEVQSQDLSSQRRLVTTAAGALVMYPNDARGDWFYSNNHGQIWVQVQRLQDAQPCTDTITP